MTGSSSDRWLSWLLNAVYVALLIAVSPVLLFRSLTQGKYRTGWSQKLWGRVPVWPATYDATRQRVPRVWLHAVSVGEVLLLESVIPELRRLCPSVEVLITTTTSTGHAVALQKFPDCRLAYCPLDFSWAVQSALQRLQPTQLVLVELELWPNLILAAHAAGVRLSIINGRLSERSYRGYQRLRGLMRRLLPLFDVIAVQSATYARRFVMLGANGPAVRITGSVKFDRVDVQKQRALTDALRQAFCLDTHERVFIAGSTQAPEELIAIRAWQAARTLDPNLRLILVPRHKERFVEVAQLVKSLQLPLQRRSDTQPESCQTSDKPVLLLDTLGELTACWGLADFAFVGGSLTNRGGQNMLEPAAYGAAVCFGPKTRHFRDTVEALLERQAAIVVSDEAALTAQLKQWLTHPLSAQELGHRASEFVASQRGASLRTAELLMPIAIPSANTTGSSIRAA